MLQSCCVNSILEWVQDTQVLEGFSCKETSERAYKEYRSLIGSLSPAGLRPADRYSGVFKNCATPQGIAHEERFTEMLHSIPDHIMKKNLFALQPSAQVGVAMCAGLLYVCPSVSMYVSVRMSPCMSLFVCLHVCVCLSVSMCVSVRMFLCMSLFCSYVSMYVSFRRSAPTSVPTSVICLCVCTHARSRGQLQAQFLVRSNFASSLAAMNTSHYLLGIGDRHDGNTLVSSRGLLIGTHACCTATLIKYSIQPRHV